MMEYVKLLPLVMGLACLWVAYKESNDYSKPADVRAGGAVFYVIGVALILVWIVL